MIGRFSKMGVYRELLRLRDFYISGFAGLLALAAFLFDIGKDGPSMIGIGLAVIAVALNGAPIIWGAIKGLWEKRVNVDELVSLAIIASLVQGEFLTAAVVSFVMTFGALIEEVTSESARKAIGSLIRIAPQTATVIAPDGSYIEKSVEEVSVGDKILIKPGERIPVDATLTDGITAVDESAMTGEPLPREKHPGDPLLAGTLNHNGVIEAVVVKVGQDSTLGKVIRLVSEAESHRPVAIRLIDRYARWFTPVILACAGIAWLLTGDVDRAVAVLIVGCPCALILAAPTATVAALGRAAKEGVLIKGGRYLERIAAADTVLFDKTGTLTLGEPRVHNIACIEGEDRDAVLCEAASAEANCTHPLARAVLKAAQYARITLKKAEGVINEIGLGVKAQVNGSVIEVGGIGPGGGAAAITGPLRGCLDELVEKGATPLVVYRDSRPVGVLGVSDHPRPAAEKMVARLRTLGLDELAVLSGDHERSAHRIARSVGIENVHAGLRPQDKMDIIKTYQSGGKTVVFVGDGVNDGPALASADVGIAMGAAGTDVALETADVALMHDDVSKLPFLFKLSRRLLKVIKFNIAFGMAFNAAAVIAGGTGLLSPIAAAITHNVGSVLVVMSSAGLAFFRDKE